VRNLIPSFILEKHQENETHGSFKAATMFIDISGFTAMTQELMKNGKEGAEVLNEILNNIFEPVIDAVYDRGGFISTFAGDAFTAIFPDVKQPIDCCNAAMNIQQIFKRIGNQGTRFGQFDLSVKIGLAHGKAEWGIVGYEDHKTYYFRGSAINNCAKAEHKCDKMQIVIHKGLLLHISDDIKSEPINKTYCYLTDFTQLELKHKPVTEPSIIEKAVTQFIPISVLEYRQKGEFRDVVNVFISFKEPSTFNKLDKFSGGLLETADRFGGYFEVLDFGDKGGNCLVIFGAPVSHENNIDRAINFIEELRIEYRDEIRAGITFGTVFAGFKGSTRRSVYGVIGSVVNLSARFMMKAVWGEILTDKNTYERIKSQHELEVLTSQSFKGFESRIPVFKLLRHKKQKRASFFEGEMIGREKEMKQLSKLLRPLKDDKFGGIVYVYGNPGIGKSRLIYELAKDANIRTLTLQCDSILKQGLNPFAYFLNDYFKQSEAHSIDDRKTIFKKKYSELVISADKDQIQELNRIESIIGSIIGLHWDGSIFEIIEAKDRPTIIQFAIKSFIANLITIEPVILHIEDIQWIDDASQEAFQILTRLIEDTPFIILASSRYNDDGSKPVLKADDDVKHNEIILDELQADSIETLIENSLSLKPDDELVRYIQSRTEGNPFYTEQFCLYLKENDLIRQGGEFYQLTGKPVDIPVGINMIVIARIDRLSAELKETVQVASVLGREFEVHVLKELIDLLCQVKSKKKHILRNRDIQPIVTKIEEEKVWSNLAELRYIFSHALLRDAAYEMQLKARLRSLHKLAGDTIVKVFPEDKEKLAETAYHYELAEDWDKAREYCAKAGVYCQESVKYDEATNYYQKALSICETTLEADNPEFATSLNNLAQIYSIRGLYDKAEPLYNRALEINEKVFGLEHPDVATNMNSLAVLYREQGLYDKAEPLYLRALEIKEKVLGMQHPDVAASLNNIAVLYHDQGLYDKAEPLCERALEIREEVLGPEHPDVAISLNNLAALYQEHDHYDKAELLHLRTLKTREKVLGEQHPDVAASLNNLATLYLYQGLYDKAEPLFERAQVINEKVLGLEHPLVAINLNNLAGLYRVQGLYDKAEPLFERALYIKEKVFGLQHPSIATNLNGLALLYLHQGLYDKAEPLFERALEIKEKVLGPRHPDVALSLHNLAYLYNKQGLYDKAKPLYERALVIWKKVHGPEHPLVATCLNNLAVLYRVQSLYDKAEPLFKRAIKICEKALPGHPNLMMYIDNYAKLLEETNRPEEAQEMRERAQAIRDKNA